MGEYVVALDHLDAAGGVLLGREHEVGRDALDHLDGGEHEAPRLRRRGLGARGAS